MEPCGDKHLPQQPSPSDTQLAEVVEADADAAKRSGGAGLRAAHPMGSREGESEASGRQSRQGRSLACRPKNAGDNDPIGSLQNTKRNIKVNGPGERRVRGRRRLWMGLS